MMLGRRDTSPVATSEPSGDTARHVASPACPSWKLCKIAKARTLYQDGRRMMMKARGKNKA